MVVFVFVPLVYSPITINGSYCAANPEHCEVAAYESPSCAVLGVGIVWGHWSVENGVNAVTPDRWYYSMACPPKYINGP